MRNDQLVMADEICSFHAEDVSIDNRYTFEGRTVESGESMVYLVETRNGSRGTLIDANGSLTDTKLASFNRAVDKIKEDSDIIERRS